MTLGIGKSLKILIPASDPTSQTLPYKKRLIEVLTGFRTWFWNLAFARNILNSSNISCGCGSSLMMCSASSFNVSSTCVNGSRGPPAFSKYFANVWDIVIWNHIHLFTGCATYIAKIKCHIQVNCTIMFFLIYHEGRWGNKCRHRYTLLLKKVYTLFPSKYSKCRLSRARNLLEGQPIRVLQQAWVCEKKVVPNSELQGKVCWEVMSESSQKSVFAMDFFVTGWQSACLQTLLQNFGTTLNFFTNSVLFGVELQWAVPHTMSWVLNDLGFGYSLTETQSVYFLLELSVHRLYFH